MWTTQSKLILILEDEQEQQDLIRFWLKRNRPEVRYIFCENGYRLIEILPTLEQLPGLTVLDVRTPPLDGIQTLQWYKANLPDAHVVMFSGSELEREECEKLGCNSYYLKPYEPKDMGPTLDRIIRENYPIDPYSSNPL
jgi:CheY-like chemotaxis protein